jgi:formamidopyrimidine-DNA glycosylase
VPELPDVELYVEKLTDRLEGHVLQAVRVRGPFLLRSVDPPLSDATGRRVCEVRRIGKRIAWGLEGGYWIIIHLMIAGRLHWKESPPQLSGKNQLASLDFDVGSVMLTESGHKKRASMYFVCGDDARDEHDPGGIEPLSCSLPEFAARIKQENRTLKRALTSPRTISGIGNAYSDEILHAAGLSPVQLTSRLSDDQVRGLYDATRSVLHEWLVRLRKQSGDAFPQNVTAFRPEMAVHGRFGKPCPVCQSPVQRIRYKSNETNYCASCQTDGKILADRSLSRLLKDNWPGSLE